MLILNPDIGVIRSKKKAHLLHSIIIKSRSQNASLLIGCNILIRNIIKIIFYFKYQDPE